MDSRVPGAGDGQDGRSRGTWATKLAGAGPFAVLLLLAVVLGGAYTLGFRLGDGEAQASKGTAARAGFFAPEVTLPDTAGRTVTLSSYRGQVVLINLWASWCSPCRAEMPAIDQVYRRLSAEGFAVLAVNVTDQDTEADARTLAQSLSLSFPVLFDRDGRVGNAYRVQTLPTSYFVGRDGVIQEVIVGSMTEAMLEARVKRLLSAGR